MQSALCVALFVGFVAVAQGAVLVSRYGGGEEIIGNGLLSNGVYGGLGNSVLLNEGVRNNVIVGNNGWGNNVLESGLGSSVLVGGSNGIWNGEGLGLGLGNVGRNVLVNGGLGREVIVGNGLNSVYGSSLGLNSGLGLLSDRSGSITTGYARSINNPLTTTFLSSPIMSRTLLAPASRVVYNTNPLINLWKKK